MKTLTVLCICAICLSGCLSARYYKTDEVVYAEVNSFGKDFHIDPNSGYVSVVSKENNNIITAIGSFFVGMWVK